MRAFSLAPHRVSRDWSVTIDVYDSLGEGLWSFLRQIVPMPPLIIRCICPRIFRVSAGVWMRRAIRITFERNGWHSDHRSIRKPLFQIVVFRLTFSQSEPPPIIMNHDTDVIRIVEGCCIRLNVASSKRHFGEAICQKSAADHI